MLIPAVFYRGGTSRGLFFRARELAQWRADARDHIICAAMGSPDPDGRQIDGLGGGVSSLSKTAIISPPGERMRDAPGVAWADDTARAADPHTGWDIVYRFGQVPVRAGTAIDWGSTCGNLLAAAALVRLSALTSMPCTTSSRTSTSHARQQPPAARACPCASSRRAPASA